MTSARTKKLDTTRETILVAALEMFCDCGYHATAVPALAKRAGVGTGTIYRHFEHKEGLVNAVFRRCKAIMSQALFADLDLHAVASDAPPRESFGLLYRRLFRFAREHPQELAFIEFHHHAAYLDARSQALELEALLPIAAWIAAMSQRGVLRPTPVPVVIAMLWGAFVGLVKAHRLGLVTLDEVVVAAAEQSAWGAIVHPQSTVSAISTHPPSTIGAP